MWVDAVPPPVPVNPPNNSNTADVPPVDILAKFLSPLVFINEKSLPSQEASTKLVELYVLPPAFKITLAGVKSGTNSATKLPLVIVILGESAEESSCITLFTSPIVLPSMFQPEPVDEPMNPVVALILPLNIPSVADINPAGETLNEGNVIWNPSSSNLINAFDDDCTLKCPLPLKNIPSLPIDVGGLVPNESLPEPEVVNSIVDVIISSVSLTTRKLLAPASQLNLSPKLKSPSSFAKNPVLAVPWPPPPVDICDEPILIPPIEPLLARIIPDKNTFSLANPKPGSFDIPTSLPNLDLIKPLKSPKRVFNLTS